MSDCFGNIYLKKDLCVAKIDTSVMDRIVMVVDMTTVPYSFRIDEETKTQFDEICQDMGMSSATAYNMFARRVVAEKALPFTPAVIEPVKSRATIALREIQHMARDYQVTEEEVLNMVTSDRH